MLQPTSAFVTFPKEGKEEGKIGGSNKDEPI